MRLDFNPRLLKEYRVGQLTFNPDDLLNYVATGTGRTFVIADNKFYDIDCRKTHPELIRTYGLDKLLDKLPAEEQPIVQRLLDKRLQHDTLADARVYVTHTLLARIPGCCSGRFGVVRRGYLEPGSYLAYWSNVADNIIQSTASHYQLPPQTHVSSDAGEYRGTMQSLAPAQGAGDQNAFALHLDKQKIQKLQAAGWTPKPRPTTLRPGQKLWALNSESRR